MFNDGKIIGYTNKCKFELIHEEIPNSCLIKIFKPFIEQYLYALFTLNFNKKLNAKHMLYKKLTKFFIENQKFGRKYISTNKKKGIFVFTACPRINEKYNLIVKNNFNSINIDNILTPSHAEWATSNTNNRRRSVPPIRLLPNIFQSLDISSSVVDLTNEYDVIAEFTINDGDDADHDDADHDDADHDDADHDDADHDDADHDDADHDDADQGADHVADNDTDYDADYGAYYGGRDDIVVDNYNITHDEDNDFTIEVMPDLLNNLYRFL